MIENVYWRKGRIQLSGEIADYGTLRNVHGKTCRWYIVQNPSFKNVALSNRPAFLRIEDQIAVSSEPIARRFTSLNENKGIYLPVLKSNQRIFHQTPEAYSLLDLQYEEKRAEEQSHQQIPIYFHSRNPVENLVKRYIQSMISYLADLYAPEIADEFRIQRQAIWRQLSIFTMCSLFEDFIKSQRTNNEPPRSQAAKEVIDKLSIKKPLHEYSLEEIAEIADDALRGF
jgi:predicted DNA-binding protein YlxM (UPF0122 family)